LPVVVDGPLVVLLPPLPVVTEPPALLDVLLVELVMEVELVPLESLPPSFGFAGGESSPRLPHAARIERLTVPTIRPPRNRWIVSIPTSAPAARFLRRNSSRVFLFAETSRD